MPAQGPLSTMGMECVRQCMHCVCYLKTWTSWAMFNLQLSSLDFMFNYMRQCNLIQCKPLSSSRYTCTQCGQNTSGRDKMATILQTTSSRSVHLFHPNSLQFVTIGPIKNNTVLFQIMVRPRSGDVPLFEAKVAWFDLRGMCHSVSMTSALDEIVNGLPM